MMKAESEVEQQATTAYPQSLHPSPFIPHPLLNHHAVNIALIVVALIAMFWRVFFLGETLIDLATLNNQLPWGYSAGESDYQYNRRDLTDMYVTRDYFVVSAYRDGEMPLWNPYTMAGHPIYADGVTRTLSPFLLFYKFFDVPLGYSLARITELILAAIFMYIFLVAIGVSAGGALTGSLVFELSAHSMLHLTGLGWWGGLMWLPLVMLFVDRALVRRSFTQATIAGVLLAAQFFCGYMPNQIYYVGAVVLYYLFFALVRKRRLRGSITRGSITRGPITRDSITRDFALMFVTLGVGLALAATQWVPMLELLRHSNRKIVGAELGYIYLPPWYGLTLIFPNLFGAAYDTRTLTLFTALGVSHDHILYLSIAALLPFAFIIYRLKSADSRAGFFAVLAAISLVIMMTTPLYVPVTRFVPVLQVIRVAVRAGVLFLFAAATLVAMGSDSLMRASNEELFRFARLAKKFLFIALGFVVTAVIASYLMKLGGFAVETGDRGRLAFIRKSAAALASQFTPPDAGIIIPLVLLSTVVILLRLLSKERLSRRAFFASLIGLLIFDLFWASGQFNQSFERSRVYPATQITDRLRQLPPGRVLVVPSDLETNRRAASQDDKIIAPPNTLLPYQISTVTGKNQQFPKWYREYAALIEPQPNLSHVVFDQARSRFFDLLNVRYVVTHAATPIAGYDFVATAEGLSIYENKNAMPRAFFVSRVVEVNNHADAIEALRAPAFDATNTVVIESANASGQGMNNASQARQNSVSQATIIEDKRNRVVIETQNEDSGMLVLSDNYYPGWIATVDQSPAEIFRANCTMRAINIPAGRHMVSFVFTPVTFKASVYTSLATAALVVLGLIISFFRFLKGFTGFTSQE